MQRPLIGPFLASLIVLPPVCARKHTPADASIDAATVVSPAPRDAGDDGAAFAAAVARAKLLAADVRWMVAKGVTTNPAKAGEGDLGSKCDLATKLLAEEPRLQPTLDETTSLCAFDLPVILANEALDQLRFSPSQASRRLECDVAAREIARARAVRPRDARVRRADARRIETCR